MKKRYYLLTVNAATNNKCSSSVQINKMSEFFCAYCLKKLAKYPNLLYRRKMHKFYIIIAHALLCPLPRLAVSYTYVRDEYRAIKNVYNYSLAAISALAYSRL